MATITEKEEEQLIESPQQEEIPSILRTAEDGCFELYKGAWGTYIRPTFDPEANVVITKDHLEQFELREDIHRIPAGLWSRWVQLAFHFVDKVASNLEVSVRILRSQEDPSVYRILVPKQEVSAASVRAEDFNESIDIETGEVISEYPPQGWIPVGSSHSHNTMSSFFSGTDDKYELKDPGIHLVIGSINTTKMNYTIAASVVGSGRRFIVKYSDLIDATPVEGSTFHPDVLKFVKTEPVRTAGFHRNVGTTITKFGDNQTIIDPSYWREYYRKQDEKRLAGLSNPNYMHDEDYRDPFFWQDDQFMTDRTRNSKSINTEIDEVVDLVNDFILNNTDKQKVLLKLKNELEGIIVDIESLIAMDGAILIN